MHLSAMEYLDCWNTIMRCIVTFKPTYLLIDASDFEYRQLSEANLIFNEISLLLTPKNIGIVTNNYLLGSITLKDLLLNCPIQGHHVFDNLQEGLCWLNSSRHTTFR
jgi:hypothetical protein